MREGVVGKGVSPEEKRDIFQFLGELREEAQKSMDGEVEKNELEVKMVLLANELLDEEARNVKVEGLSQVHPNQVHFLIKEAFLRESKGRDDGPAFNMALEQQVMVDAQKFRATPYPIDVIVHELAHHKSKATTERINAEDGQADLDVYRTGYQLSSSRKGTHFLGFNEAVTQFITAEVIQKNKERIGRELGIPEDELEKDYGVYGDYRKLVREIMDRVARHYDVDGELVWNRIKREYFNGELMYMRRIEKALGPGSLRVIASFTEGGTELKSRELVHKVIDFLDETDPARRDEIAKEVLSDEDFKQYLKRQNYD